jgi:hypothetical protein
MAGDRNYKMEGACNGIANANSFNFERKEKLREFGLNFFELT